MTKTMREVHISFTQGTLLEFADFCRRADKIEFMKVFGNRMGIHLWGKFRDFGYDFGHLLCHLDNSNVAKLSEHLYERIINK